jgi:serine-aspartate repeat-containing protein C/D/E
VGLWSLLTGWQSGSVPATESRRGRFESLEDRRLMDADPLKIGMTYIEQDGGSDLHGDSFEVLFEGGVAGTELTELVVNGDHGPTGLSVGDMIFDTVKGGLGADDAFGLQVISSTGIENVSWQVADGGMQLTLHFQGFHAGDKLVFTIDVDEVQEFNPAQTNQQIINEGIDPIASGVEFQGSKLTASFVAPRYFDAQGTSEFRNLYDPLFGGSHLLISQGNASGLPNDDFQGKRDRSTGTMLPVVQVPRPGSIAGRVWVDPDEDCQFDAGEQPLAGVTIELLNAGGNVIGATATNAQGEYRFDDLTPGVYGVRELQPAGYLQGGQMAGSHGGNASTTDLITQLHVGPEDHLVEYNFCELLPVSIGGLVWADRNGDCLPDSGESPIAGVTIQLLDANGNLVATRLTDSQGQYQFDDLRPGTYSVKEIQPAGYIDGDEMVGSHGGVDTGNDLLADVVLRSGQHAVNYNFCEMLPVSIAGRVMADTNGNCVLEPGESGIAGVTIQLLNAQGSVIATRQTDGAGRYKFDNLPPGVYTVRELQPAGYFDGPDEAGSLGGDASANDVVSNVTLLSGDDATDYDFCEKPPATLSGYVFRDGGLIFSLTGAPPANLYEIRDGKLTADDVRIGGVMLELRNTLTGEPVLGEECLPGTYPAGPVRAVTDAHGFYQFSGLPAGNYSVFEFHPAGYFDSIDTPGSTSGIAVNLNTLVSPLMVQTFALQGVSFKFDAILQIPLGTGQHSVLNNFSEVQLTRLIIPPPERELPPELPILTEPQFQPPPIIVFPEFFAPPRPQDVVTGGSSTFTWHLSVIDAGLPRVSKKSTRVTDVVWRPAAFVDRTEWQPTRLRQGIWTILSEHEAGEPGAPQAFLFGIPGAIPVVGDWNGDGRSEIGLYLKGEWFLDLNGNGQWDADDLWAKLGSEGDRPVVGDWDGDGKDDIGVFGPEWAGDPRHMDAEPGLPDLANPRGQIPEAQRPKNPPPDPLQATDGQRLMRLGARGRERGDLIDHVFQFGGAADVPIAGDWNGDGIRSVGVFRNGKWHFDMDGDGRWSEGDQIAQFGQEGDIPVVGDFNGDGIDEIGIYRAGKWIIDTNGNRQIDADDREFQMGTSADKPVVGDWNGDGTDEPGLYREEAA